MDLVVLRWVLLVFWGLLLSFKDLNSGGVVALLRWIQGFRGSTAGVLSCSESRVRNGRNVVKGGAGTVDMRDM